MILKKMNNTTYSSPLIDEIYEGIPQTTFDFVANRMQLALRINDAIKARGWSQKQFAEAMNKKPSEINRWLSGTHNFTTDTLWHIQEILGVQLLAEPQTTTFIFEAESLRKFVLQEVNNALEKYLSNKQMPTIG
jgi:transcriptional regulator with XRE-family HTH domain